MMIIQPNISLIAALLLLAGCNDNASEPTKPTPEPESKPGTVAEALALLVSSKVIPELDHSTEIAGTDNDSNGIRDDIDRYIDTLQDTPFQKAALRQLAAALQQSLLVDSSDREAARAVAIKMGRGQSCFFYAYNKNNNGSAILDSKLEAYTVNTPERFKVYMAYNKALSGMAFRKQDGADTCHIQEDTP